MDSHTGSWFLVQLISHPDCPMIAADLEQAITIARDASHSGAYKRGRAYWIRRYGSNTLNGQLGFAKGMRWLAVLRQGEGQQKFEQRADELRNALITCPKCYGVCVAVSIERCATCGKKGCDRCLARRVSQDGVTTWHTTCQQP